MKKEYIIILLSYFSFFLFLLPEKPLRSFLLEFTFFGFEARFVSSIILKSSLLILLYIIIKKINLSFLVRDFRAFRIKQNYLLLAMPFMVIILGLISKYHTFKIPEFFVVILFFSSSLLTGFIEEYLFRGIIFFQFLSILKKHKSNLTLSALFSSGIFALSHLVNLFDESNSSVGIFYQILFAFSTGIYFTGVMLKTKSIFVPALIHGLFNFVFGSGSLIEPSKNNSITVNSNELDLTSILITVTIYFLIFAYGIHIVSRSKPNYFVEKISNK